MMYGIIAVALIFILANLPQYIRKQLTEKIADESSKAKENLQTSQLNFLTKIEWLRFFPLKKIFQLAGKKTKKKYDKISADIREQEVLLNEELEKLNQ